MQNQAYVVSFGAESGEAHMRLMHRVSGGVGTFSNRWLLVQPAVNIQDDDGPE